MCVWLRSISPRVCVYVLHSVRRPLHQSLMRGAHYASVIEVEAYVHTQAVEAVAHAHTLSPNVKCAPAVLPQLCVRVLMRTQLPVCVFHAWGHTCQLSLCAYVQCVLVYGSVQGAGSEIMAVCLCVCPLHILAVSLVFTCNNEVTDNHSQLSGGSACARPHVLAPQRCSDAGVPVFEMLGV